MLPLQTKTITKAMMKNKRKKNKKEKSFFTRHASLFILIVLVALGAWVASRWNVWFKMPDEPAYTASMKPDRILLTFGDSQEDSRNVSWVCDSVLYDDVYLELAEDDSTNGAKRIDANGEVFESRSGKACFYHAKLRQLKADKRYFYRVSTHGFVSKWYGFRTYPLNRDGFSFIYVGDVQDSIGGKANDYLKMAFRSHPDAEMLVCGGDLIERPSDHYYAETFRDLDSICTAVPFLTVTGNHDYLKGVIKKLERRFSLTFSYFLDSMVGENQVYHLNYANAEFFFLDSDREPNYLYAQRKWLKEQLEKEGKPMPVLKEKPKAEDDDVETDKIPYYLAYFNHAFELEPLYKRMYFNEGHVPEEMREIYKYKNKDIPAYRKLFRQLQAYEARQREIPQDTNEENSADSTAE